MSIGDKIRKIREFKNLKQQTVAQKLGLSVTAYGNIERNESSITYDKLERIAKVLEVSVMDIEKVEELLSQQNNVVCPMVDCDKNRLPHNVKTEIEAYKLCIEQYKKENDFLREMVLRLTQHTGK